MFDMGFYGDDIQMDEDYLNLSSLMEEFPEKKQQIIDNVKRSIYPTIRKSILSKHGLNEDEFLLQITDVKVRPGLVVFMGGARSPIHVEFYIIVEDVSGLRHRNLSSELLLSYPTQELRNWAMDLGVLESVVQKMIRRELCTVINQHYTLHT